LVHVGFDVQFFELYLAACFGKQTGQRVDSRAFSRAVVAQQAHHRPLIYVESYAFYCLKAAKFF
jgi:hypothetical protein